MFFQTALFSSFVGSLHEILDIVKLLLNIWRLGRERQDNRSGFVGPKVDYCAPLIPFLRRLETIEAEVSKNDNENNANDDHENNVNSFDEYPIVSATEAFLRYLEYPEDENINIDLQVCTVKIRYLLSCMLMRSWQFFL